MYEYVSVTTAKMHAAVAACIYYQGETRVDDLDPMCVLIIYIVAVRVK